MEEGAFQQDYERGVELERGRIWGGAFQWSAQYEGERGGREHARMAGCGGRTGVSQEYQAKHPWALSGRQGEPAKGFEQGSRAIRTTPQEDKSGNTRRVEWRPQNHAAR